MAKVTFGPIVSEARNKVGGVVFSRNPHGAYSRTWLVPHNPNTTAQAAARLSMRELSQRWASTLSDEQRAAWRSLGKLYPHIDVFRQKSIRPGLQTYLRSNLALASVGSGPLDDAPRKLSASDPAQVTATAVSGSPPVLTVNCDSAPAINEAVQIWVSRQLSTGQTYFYKYMRLVATFSAGSAGPWDPSAGWAGRFTSLAFPSKLGIGVRYVNVETGATGPMRTALITATAGDEFMVATFTLNDAQIKAIPSTRFPLVPPPAIGKEIVLLAGRALFNIVVPYVSPGSAPQLAVAQNTTPFRTASNCIGSANVLTTTSPGSADISACDLNEGTVGDFAGILFTANGPPKAGQGLLLMDNDNDGGADYTGGDPANTITLTLIYQLIDALV